MKVLFLIKLYEVFMMLLAKIKTFFMKPITMESADEVRSVVNFTINNPFVKEEEVQPNTSGLVVTSTELPKLSEVVDSNSIVLNSEESEPPFDLSFKYKTFPSRHTVDFEDSDIKRFLSRKLFSKLSKTTKARFTDFILENKIVLDRYIEVAEEELIFGEGAKLNAEEILRYTVADLQDSYDAEMTISKKYSPFLARLAACVNPSLKPHFRFDK